ncbi:MAG: mechanosensitive ion channel [Candidatus Berkelbacteria bacterium]|nr:mechanosensitive ion channel [Candidatus Berkelbacteria bacterium]
MDTLLSIPDRFWQPIASFGPKIPGIIISLIVGYFIIQIITWVLNRTLRFSRMPRALLSVIMSLALIIMWVVLFAEIARQLGLGSLAVTISGSLAVLALALASGASGLATDIISGVFLARDPDFEIGYKIKIGDVVGIIHSVDIRKIRVVDEAGIVYVFPNAKLDKDGWQVVSREVEDNKIDIKKFLARKLNKNKE